MRDEDVLEVFRQIRAWSQGDQRAPHKPLLLLLALARVQRGEPRLVEFSAIEKPLRALLREFGPDHRAGRPEYPFWRLRNDGVWEIPEASRLEDDVNASGDVPITALRAHHAHGGFPVALYQTLRKRPALTNAVAAQLLEDAFPPSLHEQILDAVGFPWGVVPKRRRDPAFREMILRIYERRCAVCGYDGRLGSTDLALDAAHVKWHAAGGPDASNNGLALCSLHHVALDRGALTVDESLTLHVSQHVTGNSLVGKYLLRFAGKPIRRPQAGEETTHPDYLGWHGEWVFRKPARRVS